MVSKAAKRKVAEFWNHQCAICGNKDFLEYHHLTERSKGGKDDYDNLILLCACCHATVHGRKFNPDKPNNRTSIDYKSAVPILQAYFANEIGTRETKEKLHLSPKTHLSESALYKRYKREHNSNFPPKIRAQSLNKCRLGHKPIDKLTFDFRCDGNHPVFKTVCQ